MVCCFAYKQDFNALLNTPVNFTPPDSKQFDDNVLFYVLCYMLYLYLVSILILHFIIIVTHNCFIAFVCFLINIINHLQENLQYWLLNPDCDDQYAVRKGNITSVFWNKKEQNPVVCFEKEVCYVSQDYRHYIPIGLKFNSCPVSFLFS